jgi:aspartyl/asparaginyl-tRNA synthetase
MKHSLHSSFYPHIDAKKFTKVVKLLRQFFDERGLLEVHTQNRLSILSACENPHSIAKFVYNHNDYPLPQTGQMWLEHELLTQPEEKGFYCLSTSYRNESAPIEGRHCMIFPMFEFELHGTMTELAILETELLEFLGFKSHAIRNYENVCDEYGVSIIENDTEMKLYQDVSDAVLLMNFPERTNPFWNMKRHDNEPSIAKKIDVILCGQETIGSAERSCDVEQMRTNFFSIEDGKYAEKLFDLFSYNRVIEELNEFLSNKFFPRVGAGVGITRLIRAMEINKLL